ncbi:MAG: aminomethyltransferase beta-barrel domain-containing protein, partial [Gemmatimonadota bacterium]
LDGTVIGQHLGYARYTIGQRRGLPGGSPAPLFVVALRPERREVVVGSAKDLMASAVQMEEVNWLGEPLQEGDTCTVQIRYRSKAVPAVVIPHPLAPSALPLTPQPPSPILGEGEHIMGLTLALLEPARAITPGQSAVLYGSDERVLGGGIIAGSERPAGRALPIMAEV